MPSGSCERCGAAKVRCKGLCARCYFADRRVRQPAMVGAAEARTLERAWRDHCVIAALMAERPQPARRGEPWKARAACRDRRDLRWAERRVTLAMRAVCEACPVRAECLATALADPTIDGVWAATSPADRVGLR